MLYDITHLTRYESQARVSVCHNMARLKPRACAGQECRTFDLQITPEPSVIDWRTDSFGNEVAHFSFNKGYDKLEVKSLSRMLVDRVPVSVPDSRPWNDIAQDLKTNSETDILAAAEFRFNSPRIRCSEQLREFARQDFADDRPIVEAVTALTARIHSEFKFDPKATTITTPIAEVLTRRRGVCQDFAHLQIGALRTLGLAARYVSGYVRTYPPPGQPRLVGADASHAWLSVFCGDAGWIDIDPTNNSFPASEHVTVAWGRDYSDVTPVRGVYLGGSRHEMHVSVDVKPITSTSR